jgi:GntR family transcriptional regulator, arabinose operon transcriptional repressor
MALDPSSPPPLYLQLADQLREQINQGLLKPQERLPPEVELADQLRVSRGTVRQALEILVQQGLLQRAPKRGTIVVVPEARPGPQLIGLIVPFLHDAFTTDILRGAEGTLRRQGYSLIFCDSEGDLAVERNQIERLKHENVSGLILFPNAVADEPTMLRQTLPPGFPLVLIDRQLPDITTDTVLVDNIGGAQTVVSHLLALGHRRIACITPFGRPKSVEARIQGYEQALHEAGILPLAAISLARPLPASDNGAPSFSPEALAPIEHLLSVADRPTALFCINDFIALGVMRHILARGLRIPDDIALAGFDDIPIALHMPVPLTTVAQPKYEIGRQAAQLLLDQLASAVAPSRTIILPTRLIVRASTSPLATAVTNTSEHTLAASEQSHTQPDS